jgi:hypothetical protein
MGRGLGRGRGVGLGLGVGRTAGRVGRVGRTAGLLTGRCTGFVEGRWTGWVLGPPPWGLSKKGFSVGWIVTGFLGGLPCPGLSGFWGLSP